MQDNIYACNLGIDKHFLFTNYIIFTGSEEQHSTTVGERIESFEKEGKY